MSRKDGLSVHRGSWWPQEKRIEAATVFAVTRNYEKTSKLSGIPVRTLKQFSQEPWWPEVISKVVKLKNDELDAKITETLTKAMDIISERFDKGDPKVNLKTMEQYHVPVSAKDTAITASILFDKRQLLRGEATTRTESVSSEDKLKALKANFEKLAKSKLINPDTEAIEGEANAVQEQELESETPPEQEEQRIVSPEEQDEVLVEEN